MSNYYASIESDSGKSASTRRGHKQISSHTRSWGVGVRVDLEKSELGSYVRVYLTGGSNDSSHQRKLFEGNFHEQ